MGESGFDVTDRHPAYSAAASRRFLEELIAHAILAGGSWHTPEELREMKVGELLDLYYPNRIEFKVVSAVVNGREALGKHDVGLADIEQARVESPDQRDQGPCEG